MTPSLPYAWAFWSAAIACGVGGLALLLWALFRDRSGGRRRCPSCWYDMSGAQSLACSECGRNARHERRLFRTRRRWKWAIAACLLLLGGAACYITPIARSNAWHLHTPTAVLALLRFGDADTSRTIDITLEIRVRDGKTRSWERHLIRGRARALLSKTKSPGEMLSPLRLLGMLGPDGLAAVPDVIRLTQHPDDTVKMVAWRTLGRIGQGDTNAVTLVNQMLVDPETAQIVRQQVVQNLGDPLRPPPPGLAEAVAQIITNPELHTANGKFIIGTACLALGRWGPAVRQTYPTLQTVSEDPQASPMHRYAALLAMSQIAGDTVEPITFHIKMLTDPNIDHRIHATLFLQDYDIAGDGLVAIPALLKAMSDADRRVSAGAASALGGMIGEDPRARTELQRLAQEGDDNERKHAAAVLASGPRSLSVGMVAPAPPAPPPAPKP